MMPVTEFHAPEPCDTCGTRHNVVVKTDDPQLVDVLRKTYELYKQWDGKNMLTLASMLHSMRAGSWGFARIQLHSIENEMQEAIPCKTDRLTGEAPQ